MNAPPSTSSASRRAAFCAGCVIVLAGVLAWANSFSAALVFDDVPAITGNASIRRLWPIWEPLALRRTDLTVSGRPLVNLSLAVNYALSGTEVWSYHALNLCIHLLAGLTLFGIVRRTILLVGRVVPNPPRAEPERLNRRVKDNAPGLADAGDGAWLALAAALLWTVHPLQTESVTYVIQRVESLMGMFYLLTLYCFIRAVDCQVLRDSRNERLSAAGEVCRPSSDDPPRGSGGIWFALSALACLLGMACKEVMVSAPLLVLLYDRTFVAGSFGVAWRQRWRFYAALAATWLLLAVLVATTTSRGGSAGFGTAVTWWEYALIQCRAVVHYLRLALWPHPLVFDYGIVEVRSALAVAPQALLLAALLAATVVALRRSSAPGFLGAWFFLVLAPSSSIVPVATQTVAEHRMYLPLAALTVGAVAALHGLLRRPAVTAALACTLAIPLGWITAHRNADYRSEFSIWSDSATKRPDNARAHNNLGSIWLKQGNVSAAIRCFTRALELQPYYASAHYNLGLALMGSGDAAAAVAQFDRALAIEPESVDIRLNLGIALLQLGRADDARQHFEAALRLQPDSADVQNDLGLALGQLGRTEEAMARCEEALRLQPGLPQAHVNLAGLLEKAGRLDEAIGHYEAALRLPPDEAETHCALADAWVKKGDGAQAERQYREAVRLKPGYVEAHFALGNLLAQTNRFTEALAEYREVLRLDSNHVRARNNLGNALLVTGRVDEAIAEYDRVLQAEPDNASVRENLARARALQPVAQPGR
ncbi:MAG TPA: tetratricopeptide repeat protein [Opitutaceae bacterium]|nr:tetratricopeptide repeat protein [Opitutaceae bacterium]